MAAGEQPSIQNRDIQTYPLSGVSLACSVFTLQFVPEQHKLPLIQRIYHGLLPGGALIIAEKTIAATALLQDALSFPYYDNKLRRGFDAQHVLDKERSLRGVMTCWTLEDLINRLRRIGFGEVQVVWADYLFAGLVAVKELESQSAYSVEPLGFPVSEKGQCEILQWRERIARARLSGLVMRRTASARREACQQKRSRRE